MSERSRVEILREVLSGTVDPGAAAIALDMSEAQVREWVDLIHVSVEHGAHSAERTTPLSPRMKRALLAAATMLATVISLMAGGGVVAQTLCGGELALRAPLRTFCPSTPASAADVNHNFRTLTTLLESRTGTIHPSNLGTSEISTQNVATIGATISGAVSFGHVTRQMINLWGTEYGIGVQNSTTYMRTGGNFAWYRGGSHGEGIGDAGGGARTMWLDSGGNLSTSGHVYAQGLHGPLGRNGCYWQGTGGGSDTGPNWTRHTAICPSGYYAAGWSCYASDYIDGGCQVYCCAP